MPALADFLPGPEPLSGDEVLERFLAWVADLGLTLYPAQEEAILELFAGRHLVLSTPTGSGKSLVATALHFKAMCEGQRSIYTAPIKALVNEKFFALCNDFGAEHVGMQTGDASINADAPIVCCTAEVLANQALRRGDELAAPYVVMDEFHYYGDRERGIAWQIPLLCLPATTFLLMSATLGNTAPIEERLAARSGREVASVTGLERPVPLDFEYREAPIHETVEALITAGRAPVYIVHFTQRECAEAAQGLCSAQVTDKEGKRAIAEAIATFRFDTPYGKELSRFLRHGIGVHHAGLLPKYRRLVEQLAQQGLLKVICGTDTLGVGVNIPIRTVLFSRLSKFDGEKVAILSVRNFLQIAGRAGRKGFDDRGWVVAQAPEHVIENKRIAAKAAAGGKKRPAKKAAPKGFVTWNQETFEQLTTRPPEPLVSQFRVSHGLILDCLQHGIEQGERAGGYNAITELIRLSHESDGAKRYHRRQAATLFRALRGAGLVTLERRGGGSRLRLAEHLQHDFSLHHTLALYLVDALAQLDRDAPTYPLDLLSLAEAILEDPHPVLYAQIRRAKGELIAQLKAEGMDYDERMARLDEVTYPKPNADFIYPTFNQFAARHPWVQGENIRPKGIGRELYEGLYTFHLYVRELGLARVEGVLLRYLGQLYNCLRHTVPEIYKDDGVDEVIAFFGALLETVDASLLEEWEELRHPERRLRPEAAAAPEPSPALDPAHHPRAFAARVRSELHHLAGALAERDYEEAARCLYPDSDDPWDPRRIEQALAPYYAEYEEIVFTPLARRPDRTLIKQTAPRQWRVTQVLLDPESDDLWCIEGEIDLPPGKVPEGPLIRLRRIGT
jgi:DNA-binding transcriptional ArsR family regulator